MKDTSGCLWGDADNDGDLDLYISSTNSLYLNDGSGVFDKRVDDIFTGDGDDSFGGTWADVDSDGDLDLFLAAKLGKSDNKLYLNDGGGSFTEMTEGALIRTRAYSGRALWAD